MTLDNKFGTFDLNLVEQYIGKNVTIEYKILDVNDLTSNSYCNGSITGKLNSVKFNGDVPNIILSVSERLSDYAKSLPLFENKDKVNLNYGIPLNSLFQSVTSIKYGDKIIYDNTNVVNLVCSKMSDFLGDEVYLKK